MDIFRQLHQDKIIIFEYQDKRTLITTLHLNPSSFTLSEPEMFSTNFSDLSPGLATTLHPSALPSLKPKIAQEEHQREYLMYSFRPVYNRRDGLCTSGNGGSVSVRKKREKTCKLAVKKRPGSHQGVI